MFKFNFNSDQNTESNQDNEVAGQAEHCQKHELKPIDTEIGVIEWKVADIVLKYVKSSDAINKIPEKPKYLEANTDLVKNVYEGGLKIWECSHDLVEYLSNNEIQIKGQKVLELGCGAALPGLFCVHKNASIVHLQDFNPEVIDFITMPNCQMNAKNSETKIELFSGDWSDFVAFNSEKFDLILTSETIYEEANYGKLIKCFDHFLAPNGTIFLAAKIHYFGVGGGLRSFEKALAKSEKWHFQSVYENCDSVHREIIKITRK